MRVSIEGNSGAGKSTLLKELQKNTPFTIYEENGSSWTFLEKYYQDPKLYAYPLQKEILLDIKTNTPSNKVIPERSALT